MVTYSFRRIVGLLVLLCGLMQAVAGMAQKAAVSQAHIKRTYYDYQGRQLHEEYQYVSTATNRFSKQGYYKEYNEDGTLWRKGSYRNNKAEGQQQEYSTSDGETWLEYNMIVHNNLRNGPYIRYSGPGEKISSGSYVNGSREGQWKFYYPEGHEVCTYRSDKKEGHATLFYKNGKVADQYAYRNDEHYDDGDVRGFYENGKPKKSGHFTKGEMDGKFLAWYPNGRLRYEENYVAGSREGRILALGQSGDTLANDRYVHDIMVAHRKSAQDVAQEAQKVRIARRDEANKMVRAASFVMEDMERFASEAHSSSGLQKPDFPYAKIYDLLSSNYSSADVAEDADKAYAIAKQLLAAMELTRALYEGKDPELRMTISKENDPAKILALMGL